MKKPTRAPAGQIRIIGGQWRGRKLPVPDSPGLRPPPGRGRGELFYWLPPAMGDAKRPDLFARSGAIGAGGAWPVCASATPLGVG
ncbi:RsmD family RNA methyltransferase, partial [Enterobacter hormaechei]|uniref:RsmD family RNA methyltransferase n=1 Tax=Enterobacter hormaechei TaxID=158836 RepID=UPI0021CF355C